MRCAVKLLGGRGARRAGPKAAARSPRFASSRPVRRRYCRRLPLCISWSDHCRRYYSSRSLVRCAAAGSSQELPLRLLDNSEGIPPKGTLFRPGVPNYIMKYFLISVSSDKIENIMKVLLTLSVLFEKERRRF